MNRPRFGCFLAALSALVVALAFAALVGIAAPRSAPESLPLATQWPTGAPHVGERLDPGDGNQGGFSPEDLNLPRLTSGGAPSQPAVANVATSEGLSGLTTSVPAPTPRPDRFRGTATWYCLSGKSVCTAGYGGTDMVAAIDTDLGFHKGDVIRVRYGGYSAIVTIVDVCGCPGERLVDLTSGAFACLADRNLGVIPVTIELAGSMEDDLCQPW